MTNPEAASTPPEVLEVGWHNVVLSYAGVAEEYRRLRSAAVVVDRSHRGRMRFFGEKSGEALTGLVTTDVLGIEAGHGGYGAALSAKGRIIADLRILAGTGGGSYLIDTPAKAWPGFLAMVKKYVNPRVSGYRDDSHAIRDLGIFGPRSREIVEALTGAGNDALSALEPYHHLDVVVDGQPVTVLRSPDLGGIEGYELFAPFELFDSLWRRAIDAGASPAGLAAWEVARVEAGRPEWGIDIDDTTIPQEANFDDLGGGAISYTKGCYIGQEVVARVHFRGHVNRHLRGLRSGNDDPPPTGAQLIDDGGNHVGDVRSSVVSPRLGGLAIGMVRREVAPGAALKAKWETGERRVEVTALPFPD
ncbi:MAG TPA: glycine cleavage T C-terminal barrel domain-containing protein [Gemmatimonadaceae bacterium]|jgi:folate-binding protein YgfZ|nr:glycine cleavage T C-terminal barrel domain-containing protein [Gemmatimonadaceae bacterium]